MMPERFRVEALDASHDRTRFSCGHDALDRYLREQAGQDQRRRLSAPFVLIDRAKEESAGYYTLSACEIEPRQLPPGLAKRLPRRPLPATLLGRLAVDLRYRGQGLGAALLGDALLRAASTSRSVGAIAVIVDAKDDAARAFYEHHGFTRFVDRPHRLYLPMTNAENWLVDG